MKCKQHDPGRNPDTEIFRQQKGIASGFAGATTEIIIFLHEKCFFRLRMRRFRYSNFTRGSTSATQMSERMLPMRSKSDEMTSVPRTTG